MAHTRRMFLTTLGGAAVAAACRGRSLGMSSATTATAAGRRRLSAVGIQSYTVRRAAAQDLAGTLSRLAQIGYREIELDGYYNHPAAEVRDILKANGLTAPSTHVGFNVVERTPAKVFEESHIVGHEWITIKSVPSGQRVAIDDWKMVAQ